MVSVIMKLIKIKSYLSFNIEILLDYNIKILSERKDSMVEVIVKNDLVKNFNHNCNDTTAVDYSITTMHEKFPKFGFDENKFFKKNSILLLKNKDLKSLYFSNCIDNIDVPISKDFSGKSLRIELQFSDNGDKVISDKIREFNFKKINRRKIIIDTIPFERSSRKVSENENDPYQ